MRLVRNALITLAILVVVFLVVGMLLPRSVEVQRSIVIDSQEEKVFALVNSMQRTAEWSPWLEIDPEVELTYEGPEAGVGNRLVWASDHPNVGNGTQEIIESNAPNLVVTALDFGDMGTAIAQFDVARMGGSTKVTWSLQTDMGMNPVGRWMGLMMDRWVGPDYEKGLANLKAVAEGG